MCGQWSNDLRQTTKECAPPPPPPPSLKQPTPAHLSFARRELASPADNVDHLGELVRRAVFRSPSLVTIVGLPRAPGMLTAAVLDVDHSILLMGRAKLRSLTVQAVGRLPGALVKLAPEDIHLFTHWTTRSEGIAHWSSRSVNIDYCQHGQRISLIGERRGRTSLIGQSDERTSLIGQPRQFHIAHW